MRVMAVRVVVLVFLSFAPASLGAGNSQLDGASLSDCGRVRRPDDDGRRHTGCRVRGDSALPGRGHPGATGRRSQGGILCQQRRCAPGTSPGFCGLPAGTDAIRSNFTVVGVAGGTRLGARSSLAWPTGQAPPPTAIMTYGPGMTILSNAAIVPLGPGEQLNVNVSEATHIVMDVNGYFTDQYNPSVSFHAVSTSRRPATLGENTSTVATPSRSRASSPRDPGSSAAAVRGTNNSTTGSGIGVWGSQAGSGFGVYGTSVSGYGVYGSSAPTASASSPRRAERARMPQSGRRIPVQAHGSSGVYGSASAYNPAQPRPRSSASSVRPRAMTAGALESPAGDEIR